MTRIHTSRNLTIDHDDIRKEFVLTVRFQDEAIVGRTAAECPRCGGKTHVTLWELEGPGGNVNTMWMECGTESPCMLDGRVLRWSRPVIFEGDWADV